MEKKEPRYGKKEKNQYRTYFVLIIEQ